MNTTVTIPDTWQKQDFNEWINKMSKNGDTRREITEEMEALSKTERQS